MSFDNNISPNFKPPINLVTTLLHQTYYIKIRISLYLQPNVVYKYAYSDDGNVNYVKHSRSKEMVNAFMVIGWFEHKLKRVNSFLCFITITIDVMKTNTCRQM